LATQKRKNMPDLSEQAIALAEQLGRIAGTVEGTAQSWMDRQALTDQLTRVRDSAASMLEGLTAGLTKGRKTGRSGQPDRGKKKKGALSVRSFQADHAHAPGKRRRKPGPSLRGVKKSDETISKSKTAAAVRQRRKSYA
jgi:hypothetical protein